LVWYGDVGLADEAQGLEPEQERNRGNTIGGRVTHNAMIPEGRKGQSHTLGATGYLIEGL